MEICPRGVVCNTRVFIRGVHFTGEEITEGRDVDGFKKASNCEAIEKNHL